MEGYDDGAVGEIVDMGEIAERLGVRHTTPQKWLQRHVMPEPRGRVGGHPWWLWSDIEPWAIRTGRLTKEVE
jgi:hypothetical protein